jgi:L-fucose mutarotase
LHGPFEIVADLGRSKAWRTSLDEELGSMLKGIPPTVSPDLLKHLCEMGHGDEIVLADSNFPGVSIAKRLLRADGLPIATLQDAILSLFPLDS